MKTIIMLILGLIISSYTYGEIKNGFEKDLKKAEQTKKNLKVLIARSTGNDDVLAKLGTQYTLVKIEVSSLTKRFIVTEELINGLRIVHPTLYNEINNIKDYNGNKTDVYIRALPEDQMKAVHWGTTNLNHAEGDEHTYQSKFGLGTVSVLVRQCERSKCLRLLVHELGHVKYQVPNLASYLYYFNSKYKNARKNDSKGHKTDDPSNLSVITELKRFNEVINDRRYVLKRSRIKKNSPIALHLSSMSDSIVH